MMILACLATQIVLAFALPINDAGAAVSPPTAIETDVGVAGQEDSEQEHTAAAPPGVVETEKPPTYTVGTHSLRGSEVSSAPAPASAITPAPFTDERGERGHFFYSDACEDCVYKAPQCGCRPAMEYFACLTEHCHSGNTTRFTDKCGDLNNKCSSELDIDCRGPDTVCEGKYSQLPSGGLGFTLDLSGVDDDAFCGPTGKCIGSIHMKVNVHNSMAPGFASGAPAPAAATPPAASTWLECGLPKVPKPDVHNNEHWSLCRAEVVDNRAACDLPMLPTLEASQDKEAYCLLTEGGVGTPPKRLTQPAWYEISNAHKKNTANSQAFKTHGSDGTYALPWMRK
jgi:hypothetical protein